MLKHHKRRAACLARTLQRWQAAGEPRPHAAPMAGTRRMPAALGLIAEALPLLLNEALRRWPDTG